MERQRIDVVLRGEGMRALALNGAITGLESSGYILEQVVGISGGGLVATLSAVGYTGRDLERISLEQTRDRRSRMTEFAQGITSSNVLGGDEEHRLVRWARRTVPRWMVERLRGLMRQGGLSAPGMRHMLGMVVQGALYSPDGLLKWICEKMEAKEAGLSRVTFDELYSRTARHLSLVVTDASRGCTRVLNHITTPQCPVVMGVRMSMGLPLVWPEVTWKADWGSFLGRDISGNTMVDGSILAGLPLRYLTSEEWSVLQVMGRRSDVGREVFGLYLDDTRMVADAPARAVDHSGRLSEKVADRAERFLQLMLDRGEPEEVFPSTRHNVHICSIPVQDYGITEFNMAPARIEALMSGARDAVYALLAEPKEPSFVRALSVV